MTIKDMSYTVIMVLVGAIFILLGAAGGFTIGTYVLPAIELWARILMTIIGLGLVVGSLYLEVKTRSMSKTKFAAKKTDDLVSKKVEDVKKFDNRHNHTLSTPDYYHFPFLKEQVESVCVNDLRQLF